MPKLCDNLSLGENRFFTLMNTTIDSEVNLDSVEYFYENFTLESLNYTKRVLVRMFNDRHQEINDHENEIKRLQDRVRWLKAGMDSQRQELKEINMAMEQIKREIDR